MSCAKVGVQTDSGGPSPKPSQADSHASTTLPWFFGGTALNFFFPPGLVVRKTRPNSTAPSDQPTDAIRVSSRGIDMIGLRRISVYLQTIALLSTVSLAGCGSPEQRAQNYYDRGMALIAKNDDL